MRVQLQNDRLAEIFSHQLLEIGNGTMPPNLTTGRISLPRNFCNLATSKEELAERGYHRSTAIGNSHANSCVAKYQSAKTLLRHAA
ncbi:unnamed protein product [Onchocerca ochengi]|uniref:Uncharacterized protein n=1 Tax=Onchocerca ochengi TaxID=42157 RepID=A0A182EJV1_ONCOC|nr:unnamed protein product [Onchocerca ochengi]